MTGSKNRLIAALLLVSIVSACGAARESRLNPFNWFGKDRNEQIAVTEDNKTADPRALVAQISSLKVDRLPGGALVHVVGLPTTQGHWAGELVALNDELPDKGVLIYEFRILSPSSQTAAGSQVSREVVVAHFVSDQSLIGVRRIQVIAQQNRRIVRR